MINKKNGKGSLPLSIKINGMKKQFLHPKIFLQFLIILVAITSQAQVRTTEKIVPRDLTTVKPATIAVPVSPLKGTTVGDMQYWNGTTWEILPVGFVGQVLKLSDSGKPAWSISVGAKGPAGGIVIYDKGFYSEGWRYLEAAPTDQGTNVMWGCYGSQVSGSANTAIGTGRANTTAIVNSCNENLIAARICDDLVVNGYSDWFLPSKDELNRLYLLRYFIDGLDLNKMYWSSSSYNADDSWGLYFSSIYSSLGVTNPILHFERSVSQNCSVRAIRAF